MQKNGVCVTSATAVLKKAGDRFVINVLVMVSLFILAVQDIKSKCVSVRAVVGLGFLSLVYGLYRLNFQNVTISPLLVIAGIVFMVFLLIMSIVLKALGMGDVIVTGMLLPVKGVVFTVSTFMLAVTLMAIVVTCGIMMKKVRRRMSVAFLPYMTVAALGVMICG
ncbi:MAG: hypothetical protein IJB96_08535 [Lachnospira sp.]|nr:hypothetical protein [Lachnospira sp.]